VLQHSRGAFVGWIAYGVAQVDSTDSIRNWQILFSPEEVPTMLFGIAATARPGIGAAAVILINLREDRRRDRIHGIPPARVVDFDEDGLMEKHPYWRYYL